MKPLSRPLRPGALGALVSLFALALFFAAAPAFARSDNDWKPVDPAELALKAPVVEKDADAEALFSEVRVADEADAAEPRTVLRHYVRIKIYNERGRESQSKVDIFAAGISGRDAEGRQARLLRRPRPRQRGGARRAG